MSHGDDARLIKEAANEIKRLRNALNSKYPHTLVEFAWACGHTGAAHCSQCHKNTVAEIERLNKRIGVLEDTLRNIASCEVRWPGDVVDVARKALQANSVDEYV